MLESLKLNNHDKISNYIKDNKERVNSNKKIQKIISNYYSMNCANSNELVSFFDDTITYNISFEDNFSQIIRSIKNDYYCFEFLLENIKLTEENRKHIINIYIDNSSYLINIMKYLSLEEKRYVINRLLFMYSDCIYLFDDFISDNVLFDKETVIKIIDYLVDNSEESISLLCHKLPGYKEYILNRLMEGKNLVNMNEVLPYIADDEFDLVIKCIYNRALNNHFTNEIFDLFLYTYSISPDDEKKFIDLVLIINPSDAIKLTQYGLNAESLNKIALEVSKLDSREIFNFLLINYNNGNLEIEKRDLLVNKLLLSKDLFYISYFALFIDRKYIKKIFKNEKDFIYLMKYYDESIINEKIDPELNNIQTSIKKAKKNVKSNIKKLSKKNK